jgi:exo-beta-1,3-glucanase (GH17 family)
MYSTDCGQLQTVADQAITLGLQLTLGIFIDGSGLSRGYSELDQLIAWGKWGSVDVINIGILAPKCVSDEQATKRFSAVK